MDKVFAMHVTRKLWQNKFSPACLYIVSENPFSLQKVVYKIVVIVRILEPKLKIRAFPEIFWS